MERIKCPAVNCNLSFTRTFNLNRHFERYHNNNDIVEKCLLCGLLFENITLLNRHYRQIHKPSKQFYEKESAFRKNVITFRFNFPDDIVNFELGQRSVSEEIKRTILNEAAKKTLVKSSLVYICEMSMIDHVGDKITTTLIPFRAPSFISNANNRQGINLNINQAFTFQNNSMEEFCNSGSNWVFDKAIAFDIEITGMRPVLVGESETGISSNEETDYSSNDEKTKRSIDGYMCLENVDKLNLRTIKNNKFIYSPNNRDQKCFLYSLHHYFVTFKNMKKTYKQFEKNLNLKGLKFPISIPQIKKFLRQNPLLDIKINILLRHTNGHVYPYEYGLGTGSTYINLLLLYRDSGNSHFLLILNTNKFLRKIYSNRSYENKFFCENCLNYFYSEQKMEKHKQICCLNKPRMEMTPENPILKFKNVKNQHPVEYIAYLDFECVLPQKTIMCEECSHLRCKCDRSFTHITTNQLPISYCFIVLDMNSQIIHEKSYSGENAADHFVEHLLKEEEDWIKPLFSTLKEMKLQPYEVKKFDDTIKCYLCEKLFTDDDIKSRDHCHFTGKFLGASCNTCNLERRKSRKLRIFMHNGSKFDFHFIIKALNEKTDLKNIHILPYNSEHFRTISFNSFLFLDSMSFLQSSLAKLSEDLSQTNNPYTILRQTDLVKTDGKLDRTKLKMVLGKSYFPYEFW